MPRIFCKACGTSVGRITDPSGGLDTLGITLTCLACYAKERKHINGKFTVETDVPATIHSRDAQELSLTPSTYSGEDDETFGPWANPSENPDYPE